MGAFSKDVIEGAYYACRTCHGDSALGSPALNAPALAGQDASYLARQLRAFKNGSRGADSRDIWGPQMALMAANLTEVQIEQLEISISALPPWQSASLSREASPRARQMYQSCLACHGEAGEGKPELGAPRISGLDNRYLARQIRSFRDAIRGAAKTDVYGLKMRAVINKTMDDAAIENLALYIQGL